VEPLFIGFDMLLSFMMFVYRSASVTPLLHRIT
jgi:hypothetical protein